jgi:hypothetical protein
MIKKLIEKFKKILSWRKNLINDILKNSIKLTLNYKIWIENFMYLFLGLIFGLIVLKLVEEQNYIKLIFFVIW